MVNHSLDTLIGRDMHLKAVDIAVLMNMQEIVEILWGKGLTGVRCWQNHRMWCGLMNCPPPSSSRK
jgi:hypothetical protein